MKVKLYAILLYASFYSHRNRLRILTSPVLKYRLSQDLTKRYDTRYTVYVLHEYTHLLYPYTELL